MKYSSFYHCRFAREVFARATEQKAGVMAEANVLSSRISIQNASIAYPSIPMKPVWFNHASRILAIFALAALAAETSGAPLPIGDRLELFVDDYLIDRMENTQLRLHEPCEAGVVLRFDRPWEGAFCGYITVLKDGDLFRMYYRGSSRTGREGVGHEVTCYAESKDAVSWRKPNLGLYEVEGTKSNNVVLAGLSQLSHNFSPFLDQRPGVPAGEKFKALAGTVKSGLVGLVSADGINWRKFREQPLLTKGAFDSQNVGFWSEAENAYVIYFRTWSVANFKGWRSVSRVTSTNFADWTEPVAMSFGATPMEHLYTSQTQPYFRAPHIYLATPMRFVPARKALTDEEAEKLGVVKGYASDCADAVLMSSRGGSRYDRTFMESLIRPGPDLGNWASRAGLTALGIVPTGENEISIYKQNHYAQPSAHLVRYRLRTDGFASVNARYARGEFVTKALTFAGRELVLNFATSAAGSVRVEVQNQDGSPVPGFTLEDSIEQIGDSLNRVTRWKQGADVSELAGKPVRLRFVMRDADLFALNFRR